MANDSELYTVQHESQQFIGGHMVMRHIVRASVRVHEPTSILLYKFVGAQYVMQALGRTGLGWNSSTRP